MRFLHLAPHYGGGIGPAAIGIAQSVAGKHIFINLHQTKDQSSVTLFQKLGLNLLSWQDFFSDGSSVDNFDYFILHYWDSQIWENLLLYKNILVGRTILLNHQAFFYTGPQVIELKEYFSIKVQSGFRSDNVPNDWLVVPTCQDSSINYEINIRNPFSMIYVGTLSYKKVSPEFFPMAKYFTDHGFTLDIYGKLNDDDFAKDLVFFQNEFIRYRGYSSSVNNLFKAYSFFFYPLRDNHFGTTENVLLEAMLNGVIPLVIDNPAEVSILGQKLASSLNIINFLGLDCIGEIIPKNEYSLVSRELQMRASELTKTKLRTEVWESILKSSQFAIRQIDFQILGKKILQARLQYPTPSVK